MSFNYGYRVRCSTCQGLTELTSATSAAEPNDAHIPCSRCGSSIHFGPAVLGCRDLNDPTHGDQAVPAFAWYHTSTDAEWPTCGVDPPSVLEWPGMPPTTTAEVHRILTTQALHVGTYEAAIESMLRRMSDQDDGDSQFRLFRVRLRNNLSLEAGWRDENHADAAQITQPELESAGVDGIRYLNVHESPGSISLAVQRRAVAAVQVIEIPVGDFDVQVPPSLLSHRADLRRQIDAIADGRPPDLDVLERFRERAAARLGEPFVRSFTVEQHALDKQAEQALIDEFLPGVSVPVRDRFCAAMGAWLGAQKSVTDEARYAQRFASMAALLTRPDEVLRLLGRQHWREPA